MDKNFYCQLEAKKPKSCWHKTYVQRKQKKTGNKFLWAGSTSISKRGWLYVIELNLSSLVFQMDSIFTLLRPYLSFVPYTTVQITNYLERRGVSFLTWDFFHCCIKHFYTNLYKLPKQSYVQIGIIYTCRAWAGGTYANYPDFCKNCQFLLCYSCSCTLIQRISDSQINWFMIYWSNLLGMCHFLLNT